MYINADLTALNASFSGPDNRPRWTTSNRINANVQDAVVMKNENTGGVTFTPAMQAAARDAYISQDSY